MSRISIEVTPELHKAIKSSAIMSGHSLTSYVLDALHEKILAQSKRHKASHSKKELDDCPLCAIYKPRGYNKRTLKAFEESRNSKKLKSYKTAKEMFDDILK